MAFRKFIDSLNSTDTLVYPNRYWETVVKFKSRSGGDLANFIKAKNIISDLEIITGVIKHNQNNEHVIYDYNSKDLVYQGNNVLYGKNRHNPLIIYTPNALNTSKVLWLSDSFGDGLAYYMEATFSHILKAHWKGVVGTPLLEELVEDWKPDYVFYTIVERDSLSPVFLVEPPK